MRNIVHKNEVSIMKLSARRGLECRILHHLSQTPGRKGQPSFSVAVGGPSSASVGSRPPSAALGAPPLGGAPSVAAGTPPSGGSSGSAPSVMFRLRLGLVLLL